MAFIVIRAEMKPSHTFDKANGLVTEERWSGIQAVLDLSGRHH
jgi:hypothetical protein